MSRTVYVNGDWVPEEAATISVFDRGFLMADGVYEVVTVLEGKLVDFAGHCRRLHRSLNELDIASPHTEDEWLQLQRDLVHRNRLREGLVYLQVTRGAEDRDFAWSEGLTPGVVMFTQARSLVDNPLVERGLDIITIDDLRWQRRDIKTVQLLYSSMGKMMAKRAGAHDAWMVEDGLVTEGTSNNAYIIAGRRLITRQAGHAILQGITRTAVLALAAETDLELEERPFTVAEAQAADEAFVTSATTFVMPVVTLDGVKIGDGKPGPMARKLREHYLQQARDAAI